jgi:hypothetical protein
MKKESKFISTGLAILFAVMACNMPASAVKPEDATSTAAALTLEATLSSLTPSPTGLIPSPTNTGSAPSLTPVPSVVPATATSNCDAAQFVTDVNYPDGSILAPNEAFTKTWRLKNVGTCSWTPTYTVVFSSGNSMSGPATQALTGNVNPGQTVDISVNLTAPGSAGDYKGYWKLRNGSGVLFSQFYIDIDVQNAALPPPPLPPAIAQVVLTTLSGEDGHAISNGTTNQFPNVGDLSDNGTAEAFVSFDMTGIPSGATITKVDVDFSDYDTLGDPWSINDGCLRAYVHNYGTLDAGDFFVGDPLGAVISWCGAGQLNSSFEDPDMKSVAQGRVGASRLQLRLQFRTPTTNNNGVADMIRFGNVKLTITYQ